MKYTSEQNLNKNFRVIFLFSGITPLLIIFGLGYSDLQLYLSEGVLTDAASEMIISAFIIVITYALIYFFLFRPPLKVQIDERGVEYYCFPYLRKAKLHEWSDIEKIAVVDVDPLGEFGGWGFRIGWKLNKGYIMRAGPGIRIHRKSSTKSLTLTINDKHKAEQVISHYFTTE